MIITARDHTPILDADSLLDVARHAFGAENIKLYPSPIAGSSTEYVVEITVPGEPPFQINRFKRGQLSTDGTESQDYRAAVAVRAALPADFPPVVAIRDDGSEYVGLVPGITAADIAGGWRDVAEGGF